MIYFAKSVEQDQNAVCTVQSLVSDYKHLSIVITFKPLQSVCICSRQQSKIGRIRGNALER